MGQRTSTGLQDLFQTLVIKRELGRKTKPQFNRPSAFQLLAMIMCLEK